MRRIFYFGFNPHVTKLGDEEIDRKRFLPMEEPVPDQVSFVSFPSSLLYMAVELSLSD